jgi:hypothetical protein
METIANKSYIEVASGAAIHLDGIRSAWHRFCQTCEDYWDVFTIWLHRNDPKMSLEEFNKLIDERLKDDV